MHDLMRAYAKDGAVVEVDGPTRRSALARLLDHYLAGAVGSVQCLYPYERDGRPALEGSRLRPLVDSPVTAQRWLDTERANLVPAGCHAAAHGWPQHAVDLSLALWRYLDDQGHYDEALALHSAAARVGKWNSPRRRPPGRGHGQARIDPVATRSTGRSARSSLARP